MKTGLTKKQKNTDLYFNAKDPMAEIYTHDTKLKRRLTEYAAKYPELCQLTEDDEQGGLRFEIAKERISIRLTAPYSEERKSNARRWAKENGLRGKCDGKKRKERKPGWIREKPLGTKGALLYMACRHVVRPAELTRLQYPNVESGCVISFRTRDCTPCARRRKVRSTPFPPCGENCVHSLAPPFPHKTGFVGSPYRYPCSNREQTWF